MSTTPQVAPTSSTVATAAVKTPASEAPKTCSTGPRKPHKAVLDMIDRMIQSGEFDILFTALKGFRNGVVYGTRVRAPHALVLNLVWSKAPYSEMPAKIFQVTKTHALNLGFSSVIFAVVTGVLKSLQGCVAPWHHAVGGFCLGAALWNDSSNPVHMQMMMYMLARVICALYHLTTEKLNIVASRHAYRVFMGLLWACCMTLFMNRPDTMQSSLVSSMKYIYQDSRQFSSWYDVLCVNTVGPR